MCHGAGAVKHVYCAACAAVVWAVPAQPRSGLFVTQGGVTVDPNELSERELEILTRKLVQVGQLLSRLV